MLTDSQREEAIYYGAEVVGRGDRAAGERLLRATSDDMLPFMIHAALIQREKEQAASFKRYVCSRRVTRSPRGDFIKDARRDPSFPDGAMSWSDLESYLNDCGACDGALEAGRQLWREYEAAQKRRK